MFNLDKILYYYFYMYNINFSYRNNNHNNNNNNNNHNNNNNNNDVIYSQWIENFLSSKSILYFFAKKIITE